MNHLLETILLGIIEGVTEFLPISSTGHLLIAQHWLSARTELFNVAIQAGAILAVVLIYWTRLLDLFLQRKQPAQRDYLFKLLVAFLITAVGGLIAKQLGLELPETVAPVAWALCLGGLVIFLVEWWIKDRPVITVLTWQVAIWVGLAQVLAAVFPGTSRSAATIFAAMLAGLTSRAAAAEFAFLLGIPTMFAATGYELLHVIHAGTARQQDWTALIIGFMVSLCVAFVVVKWLLSYIQTHRFTLFAWYRLGLGVLLLTVMK